MTGIATPGQSRARNTLPVLAMLSLASAACWMPDTRGTVHVGNDLVGTEGELSVLDSVPGDVMLAGGTITFSGTAGGDYLGAGGTQTIGGQVHGALRAAGGEVLVEGTVGRNATLAGGTIELRSGSSITGSAYVVGGSVIASGRVGEGLRVGAGSVVVRGEIGGNVTIEAGELRIASSARIHGNLRYRTEEGKATIEPGAVVDGQTTALPPRPPSRFPLFLRLVTLGGFLMAGAVFVLLAPGAASTAADAIWTRPGAALGYGLLALLGLPVVAAVLLVTVVGVPLALMACAAWLVALFLGRAIPALWLGRLALRLRPGEGAGRELSAFLIGGVILVVAQLIPGLGILVLLVATIAGAGAFAIAAAERRSRARLA